VKKYQVFASAIVHLPTIMQLASDRFSMQTPNICTNKCDFFHDFILFFHIREFLFKFSSLLSFFSVQILQINFDIREKAEEYSLKRGAVLLLEALIEFGAF